MTQAQRRHITLPPETIAFLEQYQQAHQLDNFSATIEAAASALARQERVAAYQQYARDFASDAAEQQDAGEWLDLPMDEG